MYFLAFRCCRFDYEYDSSKPTQSNEKEAQETQNGCDTLVHAYHLTNWNLFGGSRTLC